MRIKLYVIGILGIFFLSLSNLFADKAKSSEKSCDLRIKDATFQAGNLNKVVGEKCLFALNLEKVQSISICNEDNRPMEFESHDLNREKIILPNSRVVIQLPSLKKGKTYHFFEEFYGAQCKFQAI